VSEELQKALATFAASGRRESNVRLQGRWFGVSVPAGYPRKGARPGLVRKGT